MEVLLNERSLYGQFQSVEEFLKTLKPVVTCINILHDYSDMHIWKTQDFHMCQVTRTERIHDLSKYSGMDELVRFQMSLDREIYDQPHWDLEPIHDLNEEFKWREEDVTATALAEAAVTGNPLLSFAAQEFCDCELTINKGKEEYKVKSVHTPGYLIGEYRDYIHMPREEVLRIRYQRTRVDCSSLETKYGAGTLEREEFQALLSTLDKFVQHTSWESIALDDGLEYKKYKPATVKDDWFNNAKYKGKTIMKFRFGGVLRCFGYRKGDVFRVLRLERDHSISDNG